MLYQWKILQVTIMSFRSFRDLVESLKILGYQETSSLHVLCSHYLSFSSFSYVAKILQWLGGCIEPDNSLRSRTETQSERVFFMKSAVEFFLTKLLLKLNPCYLYAGSLLTARELLKITNILNKPDPNHSYHGEICNNLIQLDLGCKITDLKIVRELSSTLTKNGAVLYDLLSAEIYSWDMKSYQSLSSMEPSFIEYNLENALSLSDLKLQIAKNHLQSSKLQKTILFSKLKRKKSELDRSKERLEALIRVRPAHLHEFLQFEDKLHGLFQEYLLKMQSEYVLRAQKGVKMKDRLPIFTPATTKKTVGNFMHGGMIVDDFISDDENKNYNFSTELESLPSCHDGNKTVKKCSVRGTSRKNIIQETKIHGTSQNSKSKTDTALCRHKITGRVLDSNYQIESDEFSDTDLGAGYDFSSDEGITLSKLAENSSIEIASNNKNHSDEDF